MTDNEKIMVASCIAHLLEHIDTGEALDYGASISNLHESGLVKWAEDNAALLPVRRDGADQAERFNVNL